MLTCITVGNTSTRQAMRVRYLPKRMVLLVLVVPDRLAICYTNHEADTNTPDQWQYPTTINELPTFLFPAWRRCVLAFEVQTGYN